MRHRHRKSEGGDLRLSEIWKDGHTNPLGILREVADFTNVRDMSDDTKRYNQKLLDDKANKVFKVFLEAVLAYDQDQTYCSDDKLVMDCVEKLVTDVGDISSFRRELALFYFGLERETGIVRWDSHPKVRDALLLQMGVTYDEYLIALGQKHHRSIDDPWENHD
jgi:hypothetical protein